MRCRTAMPPSFVRKSERRGVRPSPRTDVGAYLFGTLRRRIADHYRERFRHPPPAPLPEGWEAWSEDDAPAALLERRDLREVVQIALGLLAPRDREALLARYRRAESLREIAALLGCTEKAAEMRLHHARRRLADRLHAVGFAWGTSS